MLAASSVSDGTEDATRADLSGPVSGLEVARQRLLGEVLCVVRPLPGQLDFGADGQRPTFENEVTGLSRDGERLIRENGRPVQLTEQVVVVGDGDRRRYLQVPVAGVSGTLTSLLVQVERLTVLAQTCAD